VEQATVVLDDLPGAAVVDVVGQQQAVDAQGRSDRERGSEHRGGVAAPTVRWHDVVAQMATGVPQEWGEPMSDVYPARKAVPSTHHRCVEGTNPSGRGVPSRVSASNRSTYAGNSSSRRSVFQALYAGWGSSPCSRAAARTDAAVATRGMTRSGTFPTVIGAPPAGQPVSARNAGRYLHKVRLSIPWRARASRSAVRSPFRYRFKPSAGALEQWLDDLVARHPRRGGRPITTADAKAGARQ
jgi:hypothetical protein